MSVWLIGMPGSGKSTLCNMMKGIDTDNIIDLHSLVSSSNCADDFFDSESKEIIKFIEQNKDLTIIATGGSVVHRKITMEKIKGSDATIVWLYCPIDILKKRLGNYENRGIVMPNTITTFEELFSYREKLYRAYADITIDTSINTQEDCINKINAILNT